MSEAPRILAIDCATPIASAAVLRGTQLQAEREDPEGQHAKTLLGLVDAVLEGAKIGVEDIEAFAVSRGPGTFTSLRVGLATVKGLAFGSERPVAAISTLAALAWEVAEASDAALPVAALLDARRGQCYAAVFERQGERLEAVLPEGVYAAEELARRLPAECRLAGSGADLYAEALTAPGRVLESGCSPHARAVGVLGAFALARGEGVAAASLEPDYLRGADAELPRRA